MSHIPLASKVKRYLATGVSINSANTDVATFTGLPAKYRVRKLTAFDASANLSASLATVGLYTAAGAGGTALVALALIQALTTASKCTDMTLAAAASSDYQTGSTLYVRNAVAAGSAITVSFVLEIEDLT